MPISCSFCSVVANAAAAVDVVVALSYFIFVKCPKNIQSHTACKSELSVCVCMYSINAADIVLKGCPNVGEANQS